MALLSLIKGLLVPLVVAFLLYFVLFHALIPLYVRHRARYSQYLPLPLPGTPALPDTASLRQRVTDALFAFLPNFRFAENWLWLHPARDRVVNADDEDEEHGGDEELEEAVWDGGVAQARREEDRRRLSRDLEEGFRDSSDEE